MTVVNGFMIALMFSLLLYSAYRLFRRRNLLMLIPVCTQAFALAIAFLSFINDVEAPMYIEAVFVLFGIMLPLIFLIRDYILMMKKIKKNGITEGLIEKVIFHKPVPSYFPAEGINCIAEDIEPSHILKSLKSLPDDIQKNINKQLVCVNKLNKKNDYMGSYYIYGTLCKIIEKSYMLYYNFACICYRLEKYKEALIAFKKSLNYSQEADDDEHRRYIYYNIGNTYYMLGKYYEAAQSFEKALKLFPEDLKTIENLSFTYVRNGERNRGIELLTNVPVNTDTYRAHFISGKLLYEAERFDSAEDEFRKCISLMNNAIEPKEELGKVLEKQKKYEAAIDIFNEILTIDADNYDAWNSKSKLCCILNRWSEAVEGYKHAVRLRPNSSRDYYNLAIALEETDRREEAIDIYKSAIKLNPDFTEAYNNLGIALSLMNKMHDAYEVYEEGIKRSKGDYKLYFNLGINLFETGKYTEAAQSFRKALEIEPDILETYYYLGAALTEMRYYNDAIDAYKKAMKIKPLDWELHYGIAAVYALLGRYDISVENLKKAVELNGDICADILKNAAFDGMRGRRDYKEIITDTAV